jgi:hypothetical protein
MTTRLLRKLTEAAGDTAIYGDFWVSKCEAIVEYLKELNLCCEIYAHLKQSKRVSGRAEVPVIAFIMETWSELVGNSRDTHNRLWKIMEELLWRKDEIEMGMIMAFGAHRTSTKYPMHMATIARLQLLKRSTLGIDPFTKKGGYIVW